MAKSRKIRYAVLGLGHIAQAAVLPAFANARRNSQLVALFSSDAKKLRALGRRYGVRQLYSYEQYEDALAKGGIDAVYIALPNSMHHDFTLRAAWAGVHVLCEKPMALTVKECEEMIRACEDRGVKLMVAYRLHFEEANLKTVDLLQSGKLGDPRIFSSEFAMQVREGDIRTQAALGGGPLWDIGIYCVNAARYIFQAEPIEGAAFAAKSADPRFAEVDEAVSAVLLFPGERLAAFTCSFGAKDVANYRVLGTRGAVRLVNAYEYALDMRQEVTIGDRTRTKKFARRDQFGPELVYFSDCILRDRAPEPSGTEGLADVRVIRGLLDAAASWQRVRFPAVVKGTRPSLAQEIDRPARREPPLVHAKQPSK